MPLCNLCLNIEGREKKNNILRDTINYKIKW